MLSSRTEMQKVIETARAQSYAAFMQTPAATVPMPAVVPSIIPAAVPEIKKASSKDRDSDRSSDKRDRKRSRSRDRKERDRRDKRHRDRTRSRSRDRNKDRRRRNRSRSKGRSRSRDRKSREPRRSQDKTSYGQKEPKKRPEVWAAPSNDTLTIAQQATTNLLANFSQFDEARRNLSSLSAAPNNGSSFSPPNFGLGRPRDSWPPQNGPSENGLNNFLNRSENALLNNRSDSLLGNRTGLSQQQFVPNRRFPRSNWPQENEPMNNERGEREVLPNCCVRLQPFYGGYSDVRRFFQGSFISNTGIKFINDDFGHRTGMVYIQFVNLRGKSEALCKNGDVLNGVKVEVVHLDDQKFNDAVDRFQPTGFMEEEEPRPKYRSKNITKYFNKPEPELKDYSCLTVEDLPTYVKEQDILKMFSNRPLLSLYLTPKTRGGHIAYVKFGSAEEAKKALEETTNPTVEGKSVTLKPCEDKDFEAINQQHDETLESKPSPPELIIDTDCINLTRLPLQTNNVEIADFFSDIGVRPTKIHLMNNRMGFTGQSFCEFKSLEEAAKALTKDGASFGPNQVSLQPIPREEMEHILKNTNAPTPQTGLLPLRPNMMNQMRPFFPRGGFDGGGRGGPRFMGHRGPPRPRFMNAVSNEDGPPGCTVYMDNVPYKAGTNEILDFFEGYDVTNNVSRRFNPNNTPSAEAKVIFNSAEEAFRAVQEKNGHKIWERPIFLKQA